MIVRIADAMGFDVRGLVPFGSGTHSDMGQTRGAQSGEADRHAVWLEAHNLEPKMTPFDPMAILDEIQRVVAGYDISRVNLLAGNDQHLEIAESGAGAGSEAGTDCSGQRRFVQLGHAGKVFQDFELGL
jgi:NADH-quinone oxidoreductase subunit G